MTREEILNAAAECVVKSRHSTYGPPEDNFKCIADLWTAYLRCDLQLTATNVAVMLGLVKVARSRVSPEHVDNWIDLAGYTTCDGQISTEGVKTQCDEQ